MVRLSVEKGIAPTGPIPHSSHLSHCRFSPDHVESLDLLERKTDAIAGIRGADEDIAPTLGADALGDESVFGSASGELNPGPFDDRALEPVHGIRRPVALSTDSFRADQAPDSSTASRAGAAIASGRTEM